MIKPNYPVKYFRPGEYLFRENDLSTCLYLIQKGTIAIRKRKGAAEIELARVYSNEVLGELSFFDRQPRSASAMALTEVEAMELKFDAIDKVYKKVPEYFQTIIRAVAERLRKANESIRRLQKNVVPEGSNLAEPQEPSEEPTAADLLKVTGEGSSTGSTESN